jgi:hypothetical protein
VFGWLLLQMQLLVVDVVGVFSCVGVSCFWLALLELVLSPVEVCWVMLFLLFPAFFHGLLLLLQCLVVDVVGGFSCVGASCFWLTLLEFSVEGGWVMLFLFLLRCCCMFIWILLVGRCCCSCWWLLLFIVNNYPVVPRLTL